MNRLEIEEILRLIESGETFEGVAQDQSFHIKINKYVPYCCLALHNGGNLRNELKSRTALDDYQRWREESPHTGDFVDSLPITLTGMDSLIEYDLDRDPKAAIHEEARGKSVWKSLPTPRQRQESLRKHSNFYRVLHALVKKLMDRYEGCVVYDIHALNYQDREDGLSLFTLNTEGIDFQKYSGFIQHWREQLEAIALPGIQSSVKVQTEGGRGGYARNFIADAFPAALVLTTGIKKVYCDEQTGVDYPELIDLLKLSLKEAILQNAQHFSEESTNWKSTISAHLLDRKEDKALNRVDLQLTRLLKGFELLAYVNPTNTAQEERRFFRSKFTEPPKYKYSPIRISPFELKQQLGALPTGEISDVSVRNLYESVINSYFDKIDLLSTLNTKKFLYNSLRYFGRPGKRDIQNANYLLHLPPIPSEPRKEPYLSQEEVLPLFKEALDEYGIQCKIELSSKVISQVMVLNSRQTILIRPDARFTQKEANALIEHEIGVHMVTTQNSLKQSLRLFNMGLPVNTMTQEGLAILSEYLSGNITLKRLKKLAMRVIIVDMMCNGADFIECFHYLTRELKVEPNDAYTIVTRIFRGGGFTKDHLYLSGFVRILKFWRSGKSLTPLLVGKTSLDHYDTIEEMINRGMVSQPVYITHSFSRPRHGGNDRIYDYIVSGLR